MHSARVSASSIADASTKPGALRDLLHAVLGDCPLQRPALGAVAVELASQPLASGRLALGPFARQPLPPGRFALRPVASQLVLLGRLALGLFAPQRLPLDAPRRERERRDRERRALLRDQPPREHHHRLRRPCRRGIQWTCVLAPPAPSAPRAGPPHAGGARAAARSRTRAGAAARTAAAPRSPPRPPSGPRYSRQ